MKAGAADVRFAPVAADALVAAVRDLLGNSPASTSERRQWKELRQRFHFEPIVAHSPAMLRLLTLAGRVAPTEATVLITGESGTGKELLARALHDNSSRRRRPMLSINCAAIPEALLESELFGYRRGAFTGAHGDKAGLLATADGGTLFLDELAELSLATQAKLLRFLQEGTFFPVGSSAPALADVRVLAATNADLAESVKSGAFRHDLFYRLSVFPLHVPPLRERPEDVLPLAQSVLQRVSERAGRRPPLLPREVARFLLSRTWPGNVRELENTVERAVILCDGPTLSPRDFRVLDAAVHTGPKAWDLPEQGVDLPDLNRRLVAAALERTQYNVSAAARLLGLSRPALRYRMEKYGLRTPTLAA
jgi:two-component system NtrC family response regulator